jgi:GT2 family glycosyltransferase
MTTSFSTPILLLIYNRPKHTATVLESIRQMRPKQLFVAADGPKSNDSKLRLICEETRQVVSQGIDWPCDVKYLFRGQNLGCGRAVSSAIDWFFEHVDAGIILEDDILPSTDFFRFCSAMLTKYEHDESVYSVGGFSCISPDEAKGFESSYIFSSYVQIWGWATWRRSWEKYNYQLEGFRKKKLRQILRNRYKFNVKERMSWLSVFERQSKLVFNTWDYQWTFAVWLNGGKTIIPTNSLTQNIGFGIDATHTKGGDFLETIGRIELGEIMHPQSIEISKDYDAFMNQRVYDLDQPFAVIWFRSILKPLLKRVIRMFLRTPL